MKLTIEAGQTKRALHAPFAICSSNEDLRRLADHIQAELDSRQRRNISFGWFTIPVDFQGSANTPPKSWDE